MASGHLELKGSLSAQGQACPPACAGAGSQTLLSLALKDCPQKFFQSIVGLPVAIQFATSGAVGDEFVDVDCLDSLEAIEFLYIQSSAPMVVRLNAAPALLVGSGGSFPTGFGGGETFTLTIDGVAVSVTFTVAAQSAQDVANEINAAAALAGVATPRATVLGSGQIQISGILTGDAGSVVVTGGTGAAAIGFAGTPSAVGAGDDVRINGTFLAEFDRDPNAVSRVQVSGQASATIIGAGKSAL